MMKKAIIWGTALRGKRCFSKLKDTYTIIGWVDNNTHIQNTTIEGVRVFSPKEVCERFNNRTLVIICSAAYKEINKQLNLMGFTNIVIYDLSFDAYWHYLIKGYLFDTNAASYSQWGEDLIVDAIFRALGISKPKYAEVGVHSPIASSNTYLFYERSGGNGILVEVDPRCEDTVRNYRFKDEYHCVGIGAERGDFQLYITEPEKGGTSTFDKQLSEFWNSYLMGADTDKLTVPVVTFDDIFKDKGIQYLSIDIEGWDEAVICSIDFNAYRELLVLVSETSGKKNVRKHMENSGFVLFAQTYCNEIYVRNTVLPEVLDYYECQRIYDFMKYIDSKEIPSML